MQAAARPAVSALDALAGMVWAFRVSDRLCLEIGEDDADAVLAGQLQDRRDGWHWLHFDLGDRRAAKTIRRLVEYANRSGHEVPEAAIEEFCQAGTTPELHFTHGVLHGALLDTVIDLDGHELGEGALLNVVVGPSLVLTGRRRHLRGVETLRRGARSGHLGNHPIRLVEALVRLDTSERETTLEAITRTLNKIEDGVLSEAADIDRSQVMRIRHVLVRQHRELDGLRRLFDRVDQEVRQETGRPSSPPAADMSRDAEWADLGSLLQHLNALVDRCLSLLDRARLLQQEVSDQLTVQTNRQLYVLSILTAALVPPTIVVGLFGMNTGGLPLTQVPYGFLLALAMCVISSLLVLGLLVARGLIARPRLNWRRRPGLERNAAESASPSGSRAPPAGPWGAQVIGDRQVSEPLTRT